MMGLFFTIPLPLQLRYLKLSLCQRSDSIFMHGILRTHDSTGKAGQIRTSVGSRPTAAASAWPLALRNTKWGIPLTLYSAISGAHFGFSILSITKLTLSLYCCLTCIGFPITQPSCLGCPIYCLPKQVGLLHRDTGHVD